MDSETDEKWMKTALTRAEEALERGEVPVGCIFVYEGEIIADGGNSVNETKNATRHAEMNCIDDVINWCKRKEMESQRVFQETSVIVTVEPCIMCAAALFQLKTKGIVYGCANARFGGCQSVFDVSKLYPDNITRVVKGVFPDQAVDLLKQFYSGQNPNAPKSKVKIK